MNAFDKYLNETMNMLNERSINKIQAEFTDVVNKMSAMAKEFAAAEGDEKTNILAELKGLTTKKNDLIKELDAAVAGKDKDVQLAIKENLDEAAMADIDQMAQDSKDFKSFVKEFTKAHHDLSKAGEPGQFEDWLQSIYDAAKENMDEAYGSSNPHAKPAGLSKEETMVIAQKFADAMSKADGTKVTVNKRTLEEDSFDLDVDGEEFDGGSYNIYQNGNVMNMAVPSNPVYGKKNDTVDTIAKNMKKMLESVVTEGKVLLADLPQKLHDADKADWGSIAQTPYIDGNSITVLVHAGDSSVKKYLNDLIKGFGFKTKFDEIAREGSIHYYTWILLNVEESVVIEHSSQDSRELNEGELNSKVAKKLTIGDTIKTDKHTYTITDFGQKANAFRQFQVEDEAGEIYQIQVSLYGSNRIGVGAGRSLNFRDEVLEALVNESIVTEGKKLTLKRQYTENHPAVTVGKNANVRNKVLEFIKDGRITKEAFEKFVSDISNRSKSWTKNNTRYFTISEDGVSLSKFGKKVLSQISVNEATAKNPEIWVPGGFDKEIGKHPISKITRELVLKAADKWDVDPSEAIPYVEFGWDLDLSEKKNTNNMKTKFIYESFSEFVSSLSESNISLNEAFASQKLASILTGANKMDKDLPAAFYNMSKIALDKIQDIDIIELTPAEAKKEKRASAIYMYFTTNEKPNPFAGASSWREEKTIPANTLLAITDGSNEWMATEWQRSYAGDKKSIRTLKTTKRDDSAGFQKSGASNQHGSGISSMKQVAELADRAYCLDLTILKARYSTESQRVERNAARKGATAFMNDKEFKEINKKRYYDILATKAAAMPMDAIVLDAIEKLGNQIKDAIATGTKGKYDDLLIGLDPKGKEVKLNDASNLMRQILDEYSRYVTDASNNEKEKTAGYTGNYHEGSMKTRAKSINDSVKKIENKNYAW